MVRRLFSLRGFVTTLGLIILIFGVVMALTHRGSAKVALSAACKKAEKDWASSVEKNQVLYVDGCFVPNPLNIKAGESVIFTDKNQKEMWIESDKKKDALILPNFTSGQNWGIGQSYGYQFSNSGTYGYHNKSKPSDKGTIIVR